jgi:putative membrane protein
MMDGMGGWWMGAGSLVFILLLVVALLLVRQHDEPRNRERSRGATDILAERFARGEIDEDEYQSKLSALKR